MTLKSSVLLLYSTLDQIRARTALRRACVRPKGGDEGQRPGLHRLSGGTPTVGHYSHPRPLTSAAAARHRAEQPNRPNRTSGHQLRAMPEIVHSYGKA